MFKKVICGDGRASKKAVARVVVSRYTKLKAFLTQDRNWKEEYHQNMFDAVAMRLLFARSIILKRWIGNVNIQQTMTRELGRY